jgi:hypothetical protein
MTALRKQVGGTTVVKSTKADHAPPDLTAEVVALAEWTGYPEHLLHAARLVGTGLLLRIIFARLTQ